MIPYRGKGHLVPVVAAGLVEAKVWWKVWPLAEAGRVRRQELAKERLLYRSPCETGKEATEDNCGLMPWYANRWKW